MDEALLLAFPEDEAPAARLAARLGLPLARIALHRYPDGEFCPRLENVAAMTLIYQSLDQPNEKLLALILAADAARRMQGLAKLVLVAPYLPYMRQDIVFRPGEPISQAVICGLLAARFERIVTVDPHLHRTEDLASAYPGTTWRVLSAQETIATALAAEGVPAGLVVVGPDIESGPLVHRLARRLGCEAAVFSKQRDGDREVRLTPPAGLAIAGRPVLILDDICSTGGTLARLAGLLLDHGASSVEALVTHALFDAHAAAQLDAAGLRRIRATDSTCHPAGVIALDALLAEGLADLGHKGRHR